MLKRKLIRLTFLVELIPKLIRKKCCSFKFYYFKFNPIMHTFINHGHVLIIIIIVDCNC